MGQMLNLLHNHLIKVGHWMGEREVGGGECRLGARFVRAAGEGTEGRLDSGGTTHPSIIHSEDAC